MHYANPCVYSVADRYRIVSLRNRKHMASLCLILSGSRVNLGHLMGFFFFLPIACHISDDAQPPWQKKYIEMFGMSLSVGVLSTNKDGVFWPGLCSK